MKFLLEGNTLHIEICILIVEDNGTQARNLKILIQKYNSVITGIKNLYRNELKIHYSAIINGLVSKEDLPSDFKGETAYLDAIKYLRSNLRVVDIILCDYSLITTKGTKFLEEVYSIEIKENVRFFKILHSEGYEYQIHQKESFVDAVCSAKDSEYFNKTTLSFFEKKILSVILFGNPTEHTHFKDFPGNKTFEPKDLSLTYDFNQNVPLSAFLYVYAIQKGLNKFFYLNDLYHVSSKFTRVALNDIAGSNIFLQIDESLYVNKLWAGDFDIQNNKVRFITSGSVVAVLDINHLDRVRKQDTNLIKSLYLRITKNKPFQLPNPDIASYFKFR